ncbi:energy-coupling factor transporter transmembrane component T family protein [Kineococcus gynurae]|uniref:Energy-coupling factor transporter transmembrane component T family protein n=1 Tax=Kineococcus gynurae TaxID=452979 RepID=A0ABV5LQ41_9ACTN
MSVDARPVVIPPTATVERSRVGRSPVRFCGPLSVLAASLLAVPASMFVRDWRVGLAALVVELLCLPLLVRSWRPFCARIVPMLVAAASVGWSTWLLGESTDPVATAAGAALRILVLVLPGAALLGWIEPSETGDHLAQRLRVPGRPVVAAVAALEQLAALKDVHDDLARARRARGLGPSRTPASTVRFLASTSFGLLVESMRRADRMSVAMDARGFDSEHPRSWALPAPWTRADTVLVGAAVVVALVPVVLSQIL